LRLYLAVPSLSVAPRLAVDDLRLRVLAEEELLLPAVGLLADRDDVRRLQVAVSMTTQ